MISRRRNSKGQNSKRDTTLQVTSINSNTVNNNQDNLASLGFDIASDKTKKEGDKIEMVVLKTLGTRSQGDVFGELAIINPNKGRAASVKCLKDSILIALTGRDYLRYLRQAFEKIDEDKINFM